MLHSRGFLFQVNTDEPGKFVKISQIVGPCRHCPRCTNVHSPRIHMGTEHDGHRPGHAPSGLSGDRRSTLVRRNRVIFFLPTGAARRLVSLRSGYTSTSLSEYLLPINVQGPTCTHAFCLAHNGFVCIRLDKLARTSSTRYQ